MSELHYCASRFQARRRNSHAVQVGDVTMGGGHPLVVQSMTTTPTMDVEATVAQAIRMAEAGCQVVRITAQNVDAAKSLGPIRRQFSAAGFGSVPLVADIHFLPKAAMEAAEHVEKVRINPGNYADKKKFAVKEYSDSEYEQELERLHEAFSPIVLKCKELGRAMRIGTNHGSLSDRIMNRYGDTPLGMTESALEFLRIAESHGFKNIVLSMKASNPKVMIQAYRLIVARMAQEDMHYPLHLGVTEAGDGDDARIKSAIGIGSLLFDGLGDTIRVSLTEDPVAEIPVAQDLARKAEALWASHLDLPLSEPAADQLNAFEYAKRPVQTIELGSGCSTGLLEPPRVIIPSPYPLSQYEDIAPAIRKAHARTGEARIEGLLLTVDTYEDARALPQLFETLQHDVKFFVLDITKGGPGTLRELDWADPSRVVLLSHLCKSEPARIKQLITHVRHTNKWLALDLQPSAIHEHSKMLRELGEDRLIFTTSHPAKGSHPHGTYRQLADALQELNFQAPIWIRATGDNTIETKDSFGDRLLESSILVGSLICDGLGDLVSVETLPDLAQATTLAYNILQGSRARTTKTEYVACPSCGRTLFDLQTTTQRIREATGHLVGVTIAVMGCIVNGPGEMADADFGYVGGAPGKINLYVGKTPVKFNIPSEEAVERLIDLIKENGKWSEPAEVAAKS